MDAYVIIGRPGSGKSSVTRCLTGSGSGKTRTRMIARMSGLPIDLYVHLPSLQENYKRIENAADFVRQVGEEKCGVVLFSLWPHRRGGMNKRPDADTYLRHFIDEAGWHIVKVACLGDSAKSITTQFPEGVSISVPSVDPTQVNDVARQVREHFGWV